MKLNTVIRHIEEKDRGSVIEMMEEFYSSPAVSTNGSREIFDADIDNCIGDCPFVEGYVFEGGGVLRGYAMIAKSFSTEFGRSCIWLEDLYVKEEYRGSGVGSLFLQYIEEKYKGSLFRLEVEEENEGAVKIYKKFGYTTLPYMEMKK